MHCQAAHAQQLSTSTRRPSSYGPKPPLLCLLHLPASCCLAAPTCASALRRLCKALHRSFQHLHRTSGTQCLELVHPPPRQEGRQRPVTANVQHNNRTEQRSAVQCSMSTLRRKSLWHSIVHSTCTAHSLAIASLTGIPPSGPATPVGLPADSGAGCCSRTPPGQSSCHQQHACCTTKLPWSRTRPAG